MSLVTTQAEMPALAAGDPAEIGRLAGVSKHTGLRVRMDCAHLANAVAALG
jgi:threonine aldolase